MTVYCHGKKDFCDGEQWCITCSYYDGTGVKRTPTNADRIRAMRDEELAEFLAHFSNGVNGWLQQPAEEVDHDSKE